MCVIGILMAVIERQSSVRQKSLVAYGLILGCDRLIRKYCSFIVVVFTRNVTP